MKLKLLFAAALALTAVLVVATLGGEVTPSASAQEPAILQAAKVRNPGAYRAATRDGARVVVTADRRSFYVVSPRTPEPRPMIVTLHGFKSTALDQYELWRPWARSRGYGILSIQWRQGFTTRDREYLPGTIAAVMGRALRAQGTARGQALLHGYSSGSIRTFGVTALDRRQGRYVGLSIANGGAASRSFPYSRTIDSFGRRPFLRSRWVLFCARRDPHPNYTGCPAMRRTETYLERRGGLVERFIVDPVSGHSGFQTRAANVRAALAVFERVRAGG